MESSKTEFTERNADSVYLRFDSLSRQSSLCVIFGIWNARAFFYCTTNVRGEYFTVVLPNVLPKYLTFHSNADTGYALRNCVSFPSSRIFPLIVFVDVFCVTGVLEYSDSEQY